MTSIAQIRFDYNRRPDEGPEEYALRLVNRCVELERQCKEAESAARSESATPTASIESKARAWDKVCATLTRLLGSEEWMDDEKKNGTECAQAAIERLATRSARVTPETVEEERYTIPTTELVPAKKDWGRATVGMDGNCGFALLGADLQSGEAEFVEVEGWPQPTYRQERDAWGKALKKLEARLGSGPLRFEVIR